MQKPTKHTWVNNLPFGFLFVSNFLKYNLPSLFWAAFVLTVSLMPGSNFPRILFPYWDKAVHLALYFCFTALLFFGWTKQTSFSVLHKHTALKAIATAALYGLLLEVLQGALTADRQFDWADACSNLAGAVVAGVICVKLRKAHILFS